MSLKNESFYKDIIDIKMGRGDISKVSFELFYRLITVRNNEEIIIANAKTTMVCYDYKLKKVVALPEKAKRYLVLNLPSISSSFLPPDNQHP